MYFLNFILFIQCSACFTRPHKKSTKPVAWTPQSRQPIVVGLVLPLAPRRVCVVGYYLVARSLSLFTHFSATSSLLPSWTHYHQAPANFFQLYVLLLDVRPISFSKKERRTSADEKRFLVISLQRARAGYFYPRRRVVRRPKFREFIVNGDRSKEQQLGAKLANEVSSKQS